MMVVIISILSSIAWPQYLRWAERTRSAEALTILATLRAAELRYKAGDSAGQYTVNLQLLDIEGPGFGAPVSTLWNYTVTGTAANSNGVATRVGFGAKTIQINLDDGNTCAPGFGGTYGLSNAVTC